MITKNKFDTIKDESVKEEIIDEGKHEDKKFHPTGL